MLNQSSKVDIARACAERIPNDCAIFLSIGTTTEAVATELLGDGVETHTIESVRVKVFSIAKTIADCFRHRRSVGLSIALEGLQEALRQRKVTPAAMSRQAAKSGVATVMRPYLEALTANA